MKYIVHLVRSFFISLPGILSDIKGEVTFWGRVASFLYRWRIGVISVIASLVLVIIFRG